MFKNSFILPMISAIIIGSTGCTSYFMIKAQTPTLDTIKDFKDIHLGWLDLGENNWKQFGYTSQEEWAAVIRDMNVNALPVYAKKIISGKTLSFTQAKNAPDPSSGGLYIKLTDVVYHQETSSAAQVMFGHMAGSDTMDVTMHFIDIKAKKELGTITVNLYSKSASPFAGSSFEGRINNVMYNMMHFLKEKLK